MPMCLIPLTCTCVIARKITFLFEIWILLGQSGHETINQGEVALAEEKA